MPRRFLLSCLLLWCHCREQQLLVVAQSVPAPIRINVGGDAYTDPTGNAWQGDNNGEYLLTTTNSVTNSNCPRMIQSTTNDELYCSYRWFASSQQPYRYTIPVTMNDIKYVVRLHFSELHFTKIGQRIFDVYIDDVVRSSNFDILKNTKDNQPNTAYILTTTSKTVTDGRITIEFKRQIENPSVNGIEVIPVVVTVPSIPVQLSLPLPSPAGTGSTASIRINVGGGAYTDPTTGAVWKGDDNGAYLTSKTNSVVSSNCPRAILVTKNDEVYCSYRYFTTPTTQPYRYTIPVINNIKHIVKLHFAELFYTTVGQRIFDVYVEGELLVQRFDILQNTKDNLSNTAYVLSTLSKTVVDGSITIEFVRQMEHPSLNGIEIIPYTAPGAAPGAAPSAPISVSIPPIPNVPVATPPTRTPPPPYAIRINVGAAAPYTDSDTGKVWLKDDAAQYSKGTSKTYGIKDITQCASSIKNTLEDRIYCAQRYYTDPATPPAQYNVPVLPSGTRRRYSVVLHFAEIYFTIPGKRVFSVYVEGALVVTNLDLNQRVGASTSYIVSIQQEISDGYVTIDFTASIGQPFLSAVEVVEISSTPIVPLPAPIPISPPIPVPTLPVSPPVAPVPTIRFSDILINCGGETYVEVSGTRTWVADKHYIGGSTFADFSKSIQNTEDDPIYETERNGEVSYEIPVPTGSYEITLHFAELRYNLKGKRLFNINVEGKAYTNIDLFAMGGMLTAFTITTVTIVDDGAVSIQFTNASPVAATPKINGIAIKLVAPHYTHSVSNGPYVVVDVNNKGIVSVQVDGSNSHTHGPGLVLNQWVWKKGSVVLANGASANLLLPIGQHSVALTVIDNGGNDSTEVTSVTVLPFGYPSITKLLPNTGYISGKEAIAITGSGFTYSTAVTTVNFGRVKLTGAAIQITSPTTIIVKSPPIAIGIPVSVTVQTPLGTSTAASFTYIAASPIAFTSTKLIDFEAPTVATFGPDKRLYVATQNGKIAKFTLNDSFTKVVSQVVATVAANHAILGIAFDPLEVYVTNPSLYCTASFFFHGESKSSSGTSINGRILKVSGANLDTVQTIVKGLPVSDHDHGLNGVTFGDNGEMYILIGSNTNGGLAGPISGSQLQKENYYSASTVVAELSDPMFDGIITYDKEDDGKPISGNGIEVFAAGTRNSYSMVLHSNGYLYGTDNGPNVGYGKMMTGCGENEFIEDAEMDDRINIIQKGKYYGHPNPIRALVANDPRQCVWRRPTDPTSVTHEGPLSSIFPSADGIIEYEADFFDKQLRHNLIVSRYKNGLYRVILSPDGKSIIPDSIPPIALVGAAGLDVTMAPNGNLIEVRLSSNSLGVHVAKEAATSALQVKSIFPRRGGQAGGTKLTIYGINFGDISTVTVGGRSCPVTSASSVTLQCTLSGGSIGTVDIFVSGAAGSYTFQKGYRYIAGFR